MSDMIEIERTWNDLKITITHPHADNEFGFECCDMGIYIGESKFDIAPQIDTESTEENNLWDFCCDEMEMVIENA